MAPAMTIEQLRADPRVTIGVDHTTTSKGDRELSKRSRTTTTNGSQPK